MSNMFVTVITDCQDDNAFGRQATRLSQFFQCNITTIGVKNDLEAAGNLIDVLDASEGSEGIVLVNVAPRHKEAKKWENGTPFGFFYYKNTLVVSSIDGLTLSLIKKFALIENINLLDIPTVLESLKKQNIIDEFLYQHIKNTQFRSLEFLPRVAKWLTDKLDIPSEKYSISNIKDIPLSVWWVDNFGNCKTTILENEVSLKEKDKIKTKFGELTFYNRLKDVPNDEAALIVGSSGLREKRFLEIVVQGKYAADILKINSGDSFS